MGCTTGCFKCVLNSLNVLYGFIGILLIAVASVSLNTAPAIFIYCMYFVGGISLIAAILGCCGICQEHVCMTTTYAAIILTSLIFQICNMIFGHGAESITKFAIDDVERTWLEEIKHPGAMDKTQQTYYCCGKNGPNDYYTINRQRYPDSCYPKMVVNQTTLYSGGCIQGAEHAFMDLYQVSLGSEWVGLVFTALMFGCALYLVFRFRNKQRHYNY